MRVRSHGSLKSEQGTAAASMLETAGAKPAPAAVLVGAAGFDHMVPALAQDPANLLEESAEQGALLVKLGDSMTDPTPLNPSDARIPSVFTYLGQFVDHDVTLMVAPPALDQAMSTAMTRAFSQQPVAPLALADLALFRNERTPFLDLDSVLSAPAARDSAGALVVGRVTPVLARPNLPGVAAGDEDHDLPRLGPNVVEELDRRALIGDPRNDENLIVAQLHVAFLRAQRRFVRELKLSGADADRALRQHYQSIVLSDFLPRIVAPGVLARVLDEGNKFFVPGPSVGLPFEFAGAAFRLGHSMIRARYDFNSNFTSGSSATLAQLFTFTAFSGQNAGVPTLPHNWIIDWTRFFGGPAGPPANLARPIDTRLVDPLRQLPRGDGSLEPPPFNLLAVRNLLRGFLLRLPTGQALAAHFGVPPLTGAEILAVATSVGQAQVDAVTAGGYHDRTPLWFYVLAEAAHAHATTGADHLGSVGSILVAEVLVEMVRRAPDSILDSATNWTPSIPTASADQCSLEDLIRFAGLLP